MGLSNQQQANQMCSENSKATQEALEKTATLTLLDFFSSVEIVLSYKGLKGRNLFAFPWNTL